MNIRPQSQTYLNPLRSEILYLSLVSCLFVLSFSEVLFLQRKTFVHDSIQWYGLFQFFSDSLYNGVWPYWNPYTHTGEPFYYAYIQLQFLNPVKLLLIYIGKLLDANLLTLYHFVTVFLLLLTNIGTYVFLRRFTNRLYTKVILFTFISFSSFSLLSMRLLGMLEIMLYAPWIFHFCFRILEDRENPFNWTMLASLVGLSISSYGMVYYSTTIFLFFLSLLATNRKTLSSFLFILERKNREFLCILLGIVFLLSSPLWSTLILDVDRIYPVARNIDGISKGFLISPDEMKGIEELWHSTATLNDFGNLLNPYNHLSLFRYGGKSEELTESLLYIGILPFLAAIYGMFRGQEKYKANFLLTMLGTVLLMLGTSFLFYVLISYVFPLIRFQRHPMQFLPFFLLTLYYFAVIGIDALLDKYEKTNRKGNDDSKGNTLKGIFFLLLLIDLIPFNLAYRPLMQAERGNYQTDSSPFRFPYESLRYIPNNTEIKRYGTLFFRQKALEIVRYAAHLSPLYETKTFHEIIMIPRENLFTISGILQPPVRLYERAVPYEEEYLVKYFMDENRSMFFSDTVFVHGIDEGLGEKNKNKPEGTISIDEYSPLKTVISVELSKKFFLYYSDGYDVYWKAYIDNIETKLYRANINYKGVFVPEGKHVVTFQYEPVYQRMSLYAYFTTLFLLGLYFLVQVFWSGTRPTLK